MYWVYVLDNYIKPNYISVTIDMNERLKEHIAEMKKQGLNTSDLTVKYQEYHANAVLALGREKELKSMTPFKLKKHLKILMDKEGLY